MTLSGLSLTNYAILPRPHTDRKRLSGAVSTAFGTLESDFLALTFWWLSVTCKTFFAALQTIKKATFPLEDLGLPFRRPGNFRNVPPLRRRILPLRCDPLAASLAPEAAIGRRSGDGLERGSRDERLPPSLRGPAPKGRAQPAHARVRGQSEKRFRNIVSL